MTKFEEDTKRLDFFTQNKVKCSCGHSVVITNKHNKLICTHCGKMVYKNKEEEFKDRLLSQLRRIKNERA